MEKFLIKKMYLKFMEELDLNFESAQDNLFRINNNFFKYISDGIEINFILKRVGSYHGVNFSCDYIVCPEEDLDEVIVRAPLNSIVMTMD